MRCQDIADDRTQDIKVSWSEDAAFSISKINGIKKKVCVRNLGIVMNGSQTEIYLVHGMAFYVVAE